MNHIHHIIPKHMGGSDDPSNLIKLSVEDHAEAHRILFEKYGLIEDKIAWQGLAKMIDRKEIIRLIISSPKSEEHKKKISEAHKGKNKPWMIGNKNATSNKGRINSKEHNEKIALSKLGKKRAPFTEEWKQALKDAKKRQPTVECPHCGVIGKGPNMTRYHFRNCKNERNRIN